MVILCHLRGWKFCYFPKKGGGVTIGKPEGRGRIDKANGGLPTNPGRKTTKVGAVVAVVTVMSGVGGAAVLIVPVGGGGGN